MTDVTHVDRASQAWLTDPTVFEVNRTPAHSSHKWYARDPQSGQWSDLKQSLDGEWRVEVVQAADINLEEEPATAESFDDSSFERIQVPGHLQTAGLMNHKYVNVQYPWDGHENPLEPNIPENNHVALYRRKFTVSAPVANAKQAGGSVSIVFHGMATAIYVWVNGAFVGYGEDASRPMSSTSPNCCTTGRTSWPSPATNTPAPPGLRIRTSGVCTACSAPSNSPPARMCTSRTRRSKPIGIPRPAPPPSMPR